jgi:hypothetical protein
LKILFDTFGDVCRLSAVVNIKPKDKQMTTRKPESACDERASCSVTALAASTGISAEGAHAVLAALGRKNRCGFRLGPVIESLGFSLRPELSCRRLSSVLPELQIGRHIVHVRRHVYAVVDGVILDGRERRVGEIVRMVYSRNEA